MNCIRQTRRMIETKMVKIPAERRLERSLNWQNNLLSKALKDFPSYFQTTLLCLEKF